MWVYACEYSAYGGQKSAPDAVELELSFCDQIYFLWKRTENTPGHLQSHPSSPRDSLNNCNISDLG